MVSVWVTPALSGSIDNDGVVRLSDGRTFDLSSVPGNGYNRNRLDKINAAIYRETCFLQLLTDLPLDDPDRTINPNRPRLFWSDENGLPSVIGPYLCCRVTNITLAYETPPGETEPRLVPYVRDVPA